MWKPLVISLCLAGSGGWACPSPPDTSAELETLLAEVQTADSEAEGRLITNQMWELWATAPDDAAQAVLDSGLRKRASYDFLGALAEFDKLVDYCPDYAEGYNQRAFVNFIRQDYAIALEDLNRALDLSPRHVAAMAGKALTLMGLGRMTEGQDVLKQALALNPWLPERRMVLPPKGKDL